jgi:hypothetical protein
VGCVNQNGSREERESGSEHCSPSLITAGSAGCVCLLLSLPALLMLLLTIVPRPSC